MVPSLSFHHGFGEIVCTTTNSSSSYKRRHPEWLRVLSSEQTPTRKALAAILGFDYTFGRNRRRALSQACISATRHLANMLVKSTVEHSAMLLAPYKWHIF